MMDKTTCSVESADCCAVGWKVITIKLNKCKYRDKQNGACRNTCGCFGSLIQTQYPCAFTYASICVVNRRPLHKLELCVCI